MYFAYFTYFAYSFVYFTYFAYLGGGDDQNSHIADGFFRIPRSVAYQLDYRSAYQFFLLFFFSYLEFILCFFVFPSKWTTFPQEIQLKYKYFRLNIYCTTATKQEDIKWPLQKSSFDKDLGRRQWIDLIFYIL